MADQMLHVLPSPQRAQVLLNVEAACLGRLMQDRAQTSCRASTTAPGLIVLDKRDLLDAACHPSPQQVLLLLAARTACMRGAG